MRGIVFIICACLLTGCGFIRFDRPAGTILKEIPQELRGDFTPVGLKTDKVSPAGTGFLRVGPQGYAIVADSSDDLKVSVGDSVFITRFGVGYGLFEHYGTYWEGYFIEPDSKGFIITPLAERPGKKSSEVFLKKWFSGVSTITIKKGDQEYQAAVVTMNEKELETYIRKKLKKEAVEFRRIK